MTFQGTIEAIGKVIDFAGAGVIIIGAVLAAIIAATRVVKRAESSYTPFRRSLGRSILLGLEHLVAADIIRTVALTPTAVSVAILAGIVLIRTFLSFSLELEITGRWPWQGASETPAGSGRPISNSTQSEPT